MPCEKPIILSSTGIFEHGLTESETKRLRIAGPIAGLSLTGWSVIFRFLLCVLRALRVQLCFLRLFSRKKIRYENKDANGQRSHRGREHRESGDVFGFLNAVSFFSSEFVGEKFNGGVERLSGPDEPDRHAYPKPVRTGNFQYSTSPYRENSGDGLQP